MVAADDDDRDVIVENQVGEDLIDEFEGFPGRDGPVVQIAGDEDDVWLDIVDDGQKPLERVALVVDQRMLVQNPSDVPVSGVQYFHFVLR